MGIFLANIHDRTSVIVWSFPQKWFLAPLLLWALTADKKIPGLGRNAFLCVWDPSFIAARSLIDDSDTRLGRVLPLPLISPGMLVRTNW